MILDIVADKDLDTDKKWNTVADKKLNAALNKVVDTNKRQDDVAKPSILIKN